MHFPEITECKRGTGESSSPPPSVATFEPILQMGKNWSKERGVSEENPSLLALQLLLLNTEEGLLSKLNLQATF